MKQIDDNILETIYGGSTTITGTIINALTNVIKILKEASYSLGSGLRRINDNNLCPLE